MKAYTYIFAGFSAIAALLAGCQSQNGSADTQDYMTSAMDSIIGQIRTTSFPDRTWVIMAPEEADALIVLQEAIDSCSNQGGGTVVVKEGEYELNGTLWMKSNVNLHLESGALLKFSGRGDDYLPVVPTRWEGTELMGRSAMIYANGAENFAITGHGGIHGRGSEEMALWGMPPGTVEFEENIHGTHGETVEKADVDRLRAWGGTPYDDEDHNDDEDDDHNSRHELLTFGEGTFLRPCLIEFRNCKRILVEGVDLRDSPFWCLHPLYCQDVIIRGISIRSYSPNNDGCDPESSERVLIEDCFFQTGDDAVAIKSGRDADGRRVGHPSRDIVIRRCDFQSQCNGLCIGSEMSGGVENVYMDSVRIGKVKNALLFKSNKDRGGYIRNVWVRNINIESTAGAVLRFENNYFGYRGGEFPSQYENFHIERVHAARCQSFAIYYDGLAELPMRHITVDSLVVDSAALSHYLFHTEDCTFARTWVNGELLPTTPKQSETRQSCDVW